MYIFKTILSIVQYSSLALGTVKHFKLNLSQGHQRRMMINNDLQEAHLGLEIINRPNGTHIT